MRKRLSLLDGRPSGQGLAEFAQVATVFLLLLFGIGGMGTVVYRYNTVGMAAREAVRYAIVHGPNSQNPAGTGTNPTVAQIAVNFAPFLSTTEVAVSYPADTNPNLQNQQDALVTITHNYTQQIPFMSAVPLVLTTSSQMLLSQ
jgi:Flp pilus assembly protein TadG